MAKKLTFEEYLGKQGADKLRRRLEEVLKSESGFIILKGNNNRITDAYFRICSCCLADQLMRTTQDAALNGLLAKPENKNYCREKINCLLTFNNK